MQFEWDFESVYEPCMTNILQIFFNFAALQFNLANYTRLQGNICFNIFQIGQGLS